jgi:hypothetical protein
MYRMYWVFLAIGSCSLAHAQHDHPAGSPAPRAAAREWTRQPLLLPAMSRRGERNAAVLRLQGLEAASLTVFAAGGPDERRRLDYPVTPEGTKIESASSAVGNYHWVVAREAGDREVRVASTVWYFANPGPAPTVLLEEPKHELEIVPVPLPREHSGYREAEKWRFQVRLNGAPLAGHPLNLETEFGSRSSFVTDERGMATVLFPRDFRPAAVREDKGGEAAMGPRRAKFVLATEKDLENKHYLTAFNYTYSPDPDRERSLAWGAAFGLLGMAAATPLLRRRAVKINESGASHA